MRNNANHFFFSPSLPQRRLPPPPLTPNSSCWWPCGAPSPPCEGDRGQNGQISPCGPPSSPFSFFFSFCLILIGTCRASTSTLLFPLVLFFFFLFRSSLVQVGFAGAQGWLLTLARYLFFYCEIESYCRWRDLQQPWMLSRQRVWGLLPYRAFIIYPDLGVDLSKLLLVESPKTRFA